MKKNINCALTIAGSDSGGGAGIQIDLKTFNKIGVFGVSVITSLTAQNTLGVQEIFNISPEFVLKQLESVVEDINVKFAKTGMLFSKEIIDVLSDRIKTYIETGKIQGLVVDPVMKSKSNHDLLKPEAVDTLISKLIPISTVVTPNIPEAEVIAGMDIKTLDNMKKASIEIKKTGVEYVILKGGHLREELDYIIDLVYDGENFLELKVKKEINEEIHGTGCCFSAAITAYLTKGHNLIESVKLAKEFLNKAILNGFYPGNGFRVLNTL